MKKMIHSLLSLLDIDLIFSPTNKQEKFKVKLLNLLNIDLVVDVGANVGQYTLGLLSKGYKGNVISFEPLSSIYKTLLKNSKPYPKWLVYEKCALGEKSGEIEINVSENSVSSSIYNVLKKSIVAEPLSNFIGKEKTKILKLSEVTELQSYKRLHLKIDVQGYEEMVLKGAEQILEKVSSLELEISLVPLYDFALPPETLLIRLKEYGFVPYFFSSAFQDYNNGGIMQLDGLFVKRELLHMVDDK